MPTRNNKINSPASSHTRMRNILNSNIDIDEAGKQMSDVLLNIPFNERKDWYDSFTKSIGNTSNYDLQYSNIQDGHKFSLNPIKQKREGFKQVPVQPLGNPRRAGSTWIGRNVFGTKNTRGRYFSTGGSWFNRNAGNLFNTAIGAGMTAFIPGMQTQGIGMMASGVGGMIGDASAPNVEDPTVAYNNQVMNRKNYNMNNRVNPNSLYFATGGRMQPEASNAVIARGNTHEQGGIQTPGGEVENNETIVQSPYDGSTQVHSDELGYADKSNQLVDQKGKLEYKLSDLTKKLQGLQVEMDSVNKSIEDGGTGMLNRNKAKREYQKLAKLYNDIEFEAASIQDQIQQIDAMVEQNFQEQEAMAQEMGMRDEEVMPTEESMFQTGGNMGSWAKNVQGDTLGYWFNGQLFKQPPQEFIFNAEGNSPLDYHFTVNKPYTQRMSGLNYQPNTPFGRSKGQNNQAQQGGDIINHYNHNAPSAPVSYGRDSSFINYDKTGYDVVYDRPSRDNNLAMTMYLRGGMPYTPTNRNSLNRAPYSTPNTPDEYFTHNTPYSIPNTPNEYVTQNRAPYSTPNTPDEYFTHGRVPTVTQSQLDSTPSQIEQVPLGQTPRTKTQRSTTPSQQPQQPERQPKRQLTGYSNSNMMPSLGSNMQQVRMNKELQGLANDPYLNDYLNNEHYEIDDPKSLGRSAGLQQSDVHGNNTSIDEINQNTNWQNAVPFISNAYNSFANARMRRLNTPQGRMIQAPTMDARININPQIDAIRSQVRSGEEAITSTTSNAAVSRANRANLAIQGGREESSVRGQADNISRQIRNQNLDRTMQADIMNQQTDFQNQVIQDQTDRQAFAASSDNIANIESKLQQFVNQGRMKDFQDARLALYDKLAGDTSIPAELRLAIKDVSTPEDFIKLLNDNNITGEHKEYLISEMTKILNSK